MRPAFFDRYREYAPFVLRLVAGVILLEGTQDNIFSWARMVEFQQFLASRGLPFPLAGAVVSAWAQFLCGILFLLGWLTRPAAAVMVINFVAALAIAHLDGGFAPARLALLMLAVSVFLLFHGAGKPSIDERRAR